MARIRENATNDSTRLLWSIGCYIRLSKEDGNDVSVSVENQKAELDAFIRHFEEPYQSVDYYIDDGYSGTNSNRVAFQRLLQDIQQKKVNCVIVRDPSRLSRNYLEAGMYMEQLFIRFNVRFISLSLPKLDSYRNPETMNSIAVPIQNVINDDFCRQTSQKIRGVFDMKRSRGEFIGAFAPYGYQKSETDKHRFVIDPQAAQTVKDIFHWFVYDGMSKRTITKHLNNLGIPNPSAYKKQKGLRYQCRQKQNDGLWSSRTVSFILTNEVYLGNMVQGRQRIKSYKVHETINVPAEQWYVVPHTHEPIIDEATFATAQTLHQKDTRSAPGAKHLHLFAGFLKCGDCGKGMRRSCGKQYAYYCCSTHREKSTTACTRHSIREDSLEAVLLTVIQEQIAQINDLDTMIQEIEDTALKQCDTARFRQMIQHKQRSLSELQTAIDNLYIDWKSAVIDETEYTGMKQRFTEKKVKLETEIANLQTEVSLAEKKRIRQNRAFTSFQKQKNITTLDRAVLVCMIDHVLIHENKHITVYFTYTDSDHETAEL